MKIKSVFYVLMLAVSSIAISGCYSSQHTAKYSPAHVGSTYTDATSSSTTAGTSGIESTSDWASKNVEPPDHKMIYNASITVVVKKPDTANAHLLTIARKYKGYILSQSVNYTEIRVKADSLQLAMKEIALLGKVKYKNIYTQDVTEDYADLKIRLDNAKKARVRYLELLDKATTVEETLKVEKELERLNTEIDLLEGKMIRITYLEEYSTVTVTVKQRVKLGPVGFVFKYLFKGVSYLFVWN